MDHRSKYSQPQMDYPAYDSPAVTHLKFRVPSGRGRRAGNPAAALTCNASESMMHLSSSAATRTDRHRADRKKSTGAVYTPTELALFLAEQAFEALRPVSSVRILDPACGDGELLLAAAEAARERNISVSALTGYDTDPEAISKARRRLGDRANVNLHCTDFLEMMAGNAGLFDDNVTNRFEFDLVISNPPYVRTQTLGTSITRALGQRYGLSGRFDLYQAFTAAMIDALRPLGAVGLLCSNKFLTNRAGFVMRELLRQKLMLTEIVDLGDTKLFDAAVLPVIISGFRSTENNGSVMFRSVYETKLPDDEQAEKVDSILGALSGRLYGFIFDGERNYLIREGVLDDTDDVSLPWNPIDDDTRLRLTHIRRRSLPSLKKFGKVRVGVKTTADEVFIRSDWDQLPDSLRPEKELLKPLITHHNINAWHSRPGDKMILYTHQDKAGKTVPIPLDDYPRAATYLNNHRNRLESRSYVIEAGRSWYEIWVPQKPALWPRRKVVFPDIADFPRFAIDESGAVVNGDCYWVAIDDPDIAEVIMAVGNSSFCTWFYDSACGNYLYAGRRRFMTQYIERLPVPDPTAGIADHIRGLRLAEKFDEIDDLIWKLVGLEKVTR